MENEALIRFETTASTPVQLTATPSEGTQYGLLLSAAFSSMNPVSVVTCTGVTGANALAYFSIENQGRGLRVKSGSTNTIEAYDLPTYTGGVYLSGTGDDTKNGETAANAVKTFHRAAEILKNSNLAGSGEIRITGSPDRDLDHADVVAPDRGVSGRQGGPQHRLHRGSDPGKHERADIDVGEYHTRRAKASRPPT